MMFQSLRNIVAKSSISLSLTGNEDDTITVVVVPKGDGALAQPLVLTATAAELDEKFAEVVSSYGAARKSLADQVEATNAVLDAAKKESASKAVKAVTKASAAKTGKGSTPSDPDPVDDDLDGEETPASLKATTSGEAGAFPGNNLFDC